MKNKEHKHKKKYGQNFLDDIEILNNIEEKTTISSTDNVIEIGPGLGFLTNMILEKKANLIAFEIDDDLIPILNKKFSKYPNFKLNHIDFLEYDLSKLFDDEKEYKVIANIPYYITAPIISRLLEFRKNITEIYLMVQKEVAERLLLDVNTSNRSVFTHSVQFFGSVDYLFTVNKEKFIPIPKVDSAFIKIKVYKDEKYEKIINFDKYIKYVKSSFSNKRKSLANNLKNMGYDKKYIEDILLKLNKSIMSRAEELDIEDYINFIELIEKDQK